MPANCEKMSRKYWTLTVLIITVFVAWSSFASALTYCQKGTYELKPIRGREVCELCTPGTFMPFYDHRYKECFPCTQIVDPTLEILIEPCNRTHDSIIHCVDGYYRRQPRNDREKERCEKCTECAHPTVPCRTYEDTHCRQGDHFVVLPDINGMPICHETPWLCRQGHYFSPTDHLCHPCPHDTFMSLDYHSMTECWPCQSPSQYTLHKYAEIIQQCTSTHPTLIACKEGFYINHSLGYQDKDIGCSPCTNCNATERKYEGRPCDNFHDTVCCPRPNMSVSDMADNGRICRKAIINTSSSTVEASESPDQNKVTPCKPTATSTHQQNVIDNDEPPKSDDDNPDTETLSVGNIIVIVVTVIILLSAGIIIFVLYRRKLITCSKCRRNIKHHGHDPEQPEQTALLTREKEELREQLEQEKARIRGYETKLKEMTLEKQRMKQLLEQEQSKNENYEAKLREMQQDQLPEQLEQEKLKNEKNEAKLKEMLLDMQNNCDNVISIVKKISEKIHNELVYFALKRNFASNLSKRSQRTRNMRKKFKKCSWTRRTLTSYSNKKNQRMRKRGQNSVNCNWKRRI